MRKSTENAKAEARQSRDRSMRALIAGLASIVLLAATVSTYAQANRIQQSEAILQPSGDVVEHDTFGCRTTLLLCPPMFR
jgi:outer membrane biogenesis lipoprotein LolB